MLFIAIVCSEKSDLPGHNLPLGSHTPPSDIDTVNGALEPLLFHSNYVKMKRPVKFKGLLQQNDVLKNWQSDDYLRYVLNLTNKNY